MNFTTQIANHSFLVTGGAGFIGSNLVHFLLEQKAKKVIVLDDFSTGNIKNLDGVLDQIELIEGDIRDFETCQKAVLGVDYVLHQAALGSVPRSIEDPLNTNSVNISGFLNMLNAVRESDTVIRMVYAASSSTYGDSKELPKREENIGHPISPYAVTKYVNELYAKVFDDVYGVKCVGLRYFNVFGRRQNPRGSYAAVIPNFIKATFDNKPVTIHGDGLQSRDFTYIENVIQANINACFSEKINKHEVFNVACGNSANLLEILEIIQQHTSIKIAPNHVDSRKGDIKHSLASIDKASDLLHYSPKYGISEGLQMTIDWYKEHQEFLFE